MYISYMKWKVKAMFETTNQQWVIICYHDVPMNMAMPVMYPICRHTHLASR